MEPYAYIRGLPGRTSAVTWSTPFSCGWQAPESDVEAIKSIVDELHNASLLIDDIEDSSELRRGKPVAHAIYGVPATINCANYVYFLSLQRCAALKNERAMQVYIAEMLRLHQGQGLDIYWARSSRVSDRRRVHHHGRAFSACDTDFTPLLNALAVYFQIRDDYINLLDEAYMENKSFCEDLTEGKFSYPLILAIRADEEDTRLINILKQRTKNVELKRYGGRRTRAKLDGLLATIQQEIARLGGNPMLEKIVAALHATLK
ncbi:hypothetical protein PINS_up015730 [Pythium insidiosum]|nr:hypothetical protein PINS_up015730 [Pythium insidiosum]